MLKFKPFSSSILALEGFLLMAMGIYFVLLRPPLLPEDLRFMNTSSLIINGEIPNLEIWLQKVFLVLGAYIFTTGLLTIFISLTTYRFRGRGAAAIVIISGLSSIGLMTVVNFIIDSDFKWTLLSFTLPWVVSLILYRFHK